MNSHQVTATSLALVLSVSLANAAEVASSDTLITVTISGETLGTVLKQVCKPNGFTCIYLPDLSNRRGPHLHVAAAPAPQAFAIVAAAYGACAKVRDTTVAFVTCRDDDDSGAGPALEPPKVVLGVAVVEPEKATQGGVRGAVVTHINELGAGYKAGIRVGDVITSYNGEPVSGPSHLGSLVSNTEPGDGVFVTALRGATPISFNVQF